MFVCFAICGGRTESNGRRKGPRGAVWLTTQRIYLYIYILFYSFNILVAILQFTLSFSNTYGARSCLDQLKTNDLMGDFIFQFLEVPKRHPFSLISKGMLF
jgi:hypothetical protein